MASIAASNRSATVPPASPSLAHSSDSSANRMYSASANSSLDAKYRYASPRLAPASRATSRIVVASYPLSANSRSAASKIRSRVRNAFNVNPEAPSTLSPSKNEHVHLLNDRSMTGRSQGRENRMHEATGF